MTSLAIIPVFKAGLTRVMTVTDTVIGTVIGTVLAEIGHRYWLRLDTVIG